MSPESPRKLSSGAGVSAAPAGLPATGTAPGAWRGAGHAQRFGATERNDRWWLIPLVQALGLVLLARRSSNMPLVLFNILADTSLGLLVGLATRLVLRSRHGLI